MPSTLTLETQLGPVLVTLVYLAVYYAFQVNILVVKTRLQREYAARGEKLDRYFGQDRRLLAADRYQLNMLEHMPPFLALLWMNAIFVGPLGATVGGGVYVAARLSYPFLMGRRLGRGIQNKLMLSTGLGYAVLAYFMAALLAAAFG